MPILPSESLIEVLKYGQNQFPQRWLAGQLQQVPRAGEVSMLISTALENEQNAFLPSYYGPTAMDKDAIAHNLPLESYLGHPWSDELVDSLGSAVFNRLSRVHGPALRDYVVHRVSSIIGIDHNAWEMFLDLVDNYTGSMIDLLTTTRRLLKINGEGVMPPPAT
jgi:hypothetical protein